MIPENHQDLLKTKALVHVATIGPKGEPQNNPVWFEWDGTHLMISQTRTRQKYRNLQRNPQIALSMVDPENPYRYLEIRGTVDRIEEDPNKDFINHLAKKYLGMDEYPWNQPGDERVIIYIKPEHTTHMG
jgi:hypothetical protein